MVTSSNTLSGSLSKSCITPIAKAGYIARGIVYLIIGYFSALAIVGTAETEGSKSALTELLSKPLGHILLGIVAVGLIAYSTWRLVQSTLDTDSHGLNPKGLAIRAGLFISSMTHISLAWWAGSRAVTGSQTNSSSSGLLSQIAEMPGGHFVIIAVALCVLGAGVAHIWKGATAGFQKHFKKPPGAALKTICQIGLVTKGIAFIIISYLIMVPIFYSEEIRKAGVGDALNFVSKQPYGWALLSAMGTGLIAFGVYSIIEAYYRKIDF